MENDIAAVIFWNKIGKNWQEGRPLAHPGYKQTETELWLCLLAGGSVLNATLAPEGLQGSGLFWHATRDDKTFIVWTISA